MELNSNQIQEIIPHRYPFLLVDKITELEPGVKAKGIKCVTANEMHFMGHFPQHHVMPGDEIELVGPDCRPFTMTAPVMHDLEGFELYEPRTPQTVFKMKLPRYVPPMSFVRHVVSLSAKD